MYCQFGHGLLAENWVCLLDCALGLSEGVWYAMSIPKWSVFGFNVPGICVAGAE